MPELFFNFLCFFLGIGVKFFTNMGRELRIYGSKRTRTGIWIGRKRPDSVFNSRPGHAIVNLIWDDNNNVCGIVDKLFVTMK
jgi:hypothetical protein